MTPLERARKDFQVKLPDILKEIQSLEAVPSQVDMKGGQDLKKYFSLTSNQPVLLFQNKQDFHHPPLRVGVVFSGGQAPGGHNVIAGLFDALKKLHPDSRLFGFLNGPIGIVNGKSIEIVASLLANYRNQGGFDLIGSGRDKIETSEQFQKAREAVLSHQLDGLVIIGGDDSNTNAAFLAENFLNNAVKCSVIGVPKTIDGDLKNSYIETSFGFDTACKIYSEIIGNIAKDAKSAKKMYYFIKLMGRFASHVTLECALQTHPNMAFVGEEIQKEKRTLKQIIDEICDMICKRAQQGKDYGVLLIPEGIIEFIPECKELLQKLGTLTGYKRSYDQVLSLLEEPYKSTFLQLPKEVGEQLLLDRDPHGNIQVSKIETEKLLITLVKYELNKRKDAGNYVGKFSAQPHFCGYEGRSGLPSSFDCHYCYALGHVAALLIDKKVTGYMSCVQNLREPVEKWTIAGIPIVPMMNLEERKGSVKPVVKKALVGVQDIAYIHFQQQRDKWILNDDYLCPGPIQFFGPKEITDSLTITLGEELER